MVGAKHVKTEKLNGKSYLQPALKNLVLCTNRDFVTFGQTLGDFCPEQGSK